MWCVANSRVTSVPVGDSTQSSALDRCGSKIPRPRSLRQPRSHDRHSYRDSCTCRSNVGLLVIILMELKLTNLAYSFLAIDFHMGTQRLAVGTSEGVIMFDLRNATRLYVLEGHKQRVSTCSFSWDGRTLIAASLDNGVVLVWKVVPNFSSFFNPTALPRQGNATGKRSKPLSLTIMLPLHEFVL